MKKDTVDTFIRGLDKEGVAWMDVMIKDYDYPSRGAFLSDLLKTAQAKGLSFGRNIKRTNKAG